MHILMAKMAGIEYWTSTEETEESRNGVRNQKSMTEKYDIKFLDTEM